jgi:TM2 domain-containing membrane protein YozV
MAKSKGTAYVLSFLIAGVGQMYLGNIARGAVILIAALIIGFASFSLMGVSGFIPILIFFIWQIYDAGKEYDKRRLLPGDDAGKEYDKRRLLPGDGNIICPYCDSANVRSSEYCTKCGNKIQLVCESCKTPNENGVSFCGKCGKKF